MKKNSYKNYGALFTLISLAIFNTSFGLVIESPLFNSKLLSELLNDFKKYTTTNHKSHAGNLYQHSIWDSNATADWWKENKFWVDGIDEKYRTLTIYTSLLHDIGKGGDLVYEYYAKKDHPHRAFEYLTNQVPYLLDSQGATFDFDTFFKNYGEYRKIMSILVGMHWDFGFMLKELSEGKSEQETFDYYFNKMRDLAKQAHYNNGKINENLIRMSILISAADIKGADFVPSKNNIFGIKNVPPIYSMKTVPYVRYNLETKGKELRDNLLSYFQEIERQPRRTKSITQTGAFLTIPYMRYLIKKLYGNVVRKNNSIIRQILIREKEYSGTHFVFYHGASIGQFVVFETIKALYKLFYPLTGLSESFQTLRMPYAELFSQYKTVREFTENQLDFYTEIHDTPQSKRDQLIEQLTGKKIKNLKPNEIRNAEKALEGKIDWNVPAQLLSVNLSLFGNIGEKTRSECTFDYFAADKRRKSAPSLSNIYKKVFKDLDISDSFIPTFEALAQSITGEMGVIYQIFIPKDKVNDLVYLARDYGKPYGSPEAMKKLFSRYTKKEKRLPEFWKLLENNPEAVLGKPMPVSNLLNKYINNPSSIININHLQARILMTNDEMLNPSSSTKIFVYTALTPEQKANFEQKLKSIARSAFDEFLKRNAMKNI